METKCILLENMTVLLQTCPIERFTKFLQSAADVSVHYLNDNDEDTLLQSLLTGVVDAFSNADVTDKAKKGMSAVTMRVFTELCGILEGASAPVHIKCPVLEKLATCLSHCDPKQVSLLCEVSKDSPVSLSTSRIKCSICVSVQSVAGVTKVVCVICHALLLGESWGTKGHNTDSSG